MAFQPKKDKFALYSRHRANLKEGANYFADYKLKNVSDLQIFFGKNEGI